MPHPDALALQGLRQAQLEYIVWQSKSQFPFCQLITDLRSGAMAYYAESMPAAAGERTTLTVRALPTMADVWAFMSELVKDALAHIHVGGAKRPSSLEQLEHPHRVKLKFVGAETTAAAKSEMARAEWLWRQIADIRAYEDDLNPLDAISCFDVHPYPTHNPYHS